jgi:hypothetical protein
MRIAKTVFTGAGVWGLLILAPLYFTFDLVGREYPPPIAHPDLYYGFIGFEDAIFHIEREPTCSTSWNTRTPTVTRP